MNKTNICLNLLTIFNLTNPSSKQNVCFDFEKQNSVLNYITLRTLIVNRNRVHIFTFFCNTRPDWKEINIDYFKEEHSFVEIKQHLLLPRIY